MCDNYLLVTVDGVSCFSKDFVLNVGGAVWALDWCPRIDRDAGSCVKSEVIQ